jgi:hypothetical protein
MPLTTDEATARTLAAILVAARPQEDQESPAVWAEMIRKARKIVTANIPGALQ